MTQPATKTPMMARPHRAVREAARGPDLLQLAVMGMALVAVWRVQDLYPVLNAVKIQYLAPAAGIVVFLLDSDPTRSIRRILNPLAYRLLGIVGTIALSIPTSLWPGKSFNFLVNDHAKTVLLMILMAASIRSSADILRYAALHFAGAVGYSYYIITNFRVSARSGRLSNLIYYDSNDLGLLLVCTIPIAVLFLRPGVRLFWRAVASAGLALLTYTLVQTGSRGAFLGLIACGAYLLFTFTAIPARVRLYSVGAVILFLVVFAREQYWNTMSSLLSPKSDYNWTSDTGRKELWKRGLTYMLNRPLTGVGASAFPQAEGTLSPLAVRQQYGIGLKWSVAHNSFIQVGAELGVIGLGLFLSAIAFSWRYLRRIGASGMRDVVGPLGSVAHALGGSLIAYCVAGFFLSAGFSAFLYTIFGLVIGMMKLVPVNNRGVLVAPRPATGGWPAPGRGVAAPGVQSPRHPRHRSRGRYPGPDVLPYRPIYPPSSAGRLASNYEARG